MKKLTSELKEAMISLAAMLNKHHRGEVWFGDTYTKTVSSIFDRQDILERENQHLSSLRDWLLPMLMNGQVKVS